MSKKTTIVILAAALLIITGATFSDRVFASSGGGVNGKKGGQIKHISKDNGRAGTVESISDNIINIKTKDGESFAVDTGSAKIYKAKGIEINLSDIKVGDKIFAAGAISNNTITASEIFDGKRNFAKGLKPRKNFQGVVGVVTSINGNSITLTAKDNTVYVVDASNAGVKKGPDESNVSQIKSGDRLFVRGAVTGTIVVATDIREGLSGRGFKGKNK